MKGAQYYNALFSNMRFAGNLYDAYVNVSDIANSSKGYAITYSSSEEAAQNIGILLQDI